MMNLKKISLLLLIILVRYALFSQEDYQSVGFQSLVTFNPAAAGAEAEGKLRINYYNFYPGRGFDLHKMSVSYDVFISGLHGGVACFVSDDYMGGIINDTRVGFAYSYHLQAGRNIFINAGLSAAIQYRGINPSRIVMPDQIDPLRGAVLPSAENVTGKGRTIFDAGTGFIISSGKYIAGLAVNHLAKPDPAGSGFSGDALPRKLTLFATGSFATGNNNMLYFKPVVFLDMAGRNFLAGTGVTAGTETISINALLTGFNDGQVNLRTGLSIRIWRGLFYYNYCFNLKSANEIMPFSVYQSGGISISLYNVEKRKTINTIIFPEM